jgi:hypothetical protein
MKDVQKKLYIGNCHTRIRPTRMRQLVIFGEHSNDVDTTGTGSMRLAASRVVVSYGCPAAF